MPALHQYVNELRINNIQKKHFALQKQKASCPSEKSEYIVHFTLFES